MSDPNENRAGYKETKVGWIPEEWNLTQASDHEPYVTSGSRGWADYYADRGDLFLRITNLRRDTPIPDLSKRKNVRLPLDQAEGRRTRLKEGDLVVSITADLGIIGYISGTIPDPAYISQHLALLRFPEDAELNALYCAYSLASERMRNHFAKITDQGAKAGLNLDAIRSLPLITPRLVEQQKIAAILSTCDEAIEKTGALIDAKKLQKKVLMQQLLTGKRRLPGSEGEWPSRKFSDLFDRVTRKNTNGCDNNLTISGPLGLINQEEYFKKRIAAKDVSGYFLLEKGEFAYNKSYCKGYPLGAIKMLTRYDEGVVSTLYICFRLKDGMADPEFIRHFFESAEFNHELYKVAQEGARNHGLLNVAPGDFFNTNLVIPNVDEQVAISRVLEQADRVIRALDAKLRALQQQKKSLMQKLLTGQVRVQV